MCVCVFFFLSCLRLVLPTLVLPSLAFACLCLPCLPLCCLGLPWFALPCLALSWPCLALPPICSPCVALPSRKTFFESLLKSLFHSFCFSPVVFLPFFLSLFLQVLGPSKPGSGGSFGKVAGVHRSPRGRQNVRKFYRKFWLGSHERQ